MPGDPVDPRVACATITHAGAADAAKSHGTDTPTFSWMRKRAFRRAHGRAARNPSGGTFYIGQWCTTADLQGRKAMPRLSGTTSSQAQQVTRSDQTGRHKQRLRIMTYNVGGCSSDLYDTLCLYLRENTDLDILFLQELHWGLGREETTWVIPGWMFIVAPDPQRRYSGVGMVISRHIARPETVSFCTWATGRVLQVRCQGARATLDLFSVYQFVHKEHAAEPGDSPRAQLWQILGRALHSVPRRNLVVLGGDLNATVAPIPGLVGKGVLASRSRKPEEELQSCLEASSLCLLNTWGSGRACKCGTFRNGETVSQIDFLATRCPAADRVARTAGPMALDLTPAREGPKHWPVKASVPLVAGWMLKPVRPAVVAPPRYSRALLAASLDQDTAHARAFRSEVQQLVQSVVGTQSLHSLNAALIPVCARYFPEQRRTRHRPGDAPVVVQCIRHMWRMHAQLRVRSRGEMRRRVFAAWFRYFGFRQASKAVRREGKAARRRWVEAHRLKRRIWPQTGVICELFSGSCNLWLQRNAVMLFASEDRKASFWISVNSFRLSLRTFGQFSAVRKISGMSRPFLTLNFHFPKLPMPSAKCAIIKRSRYIVLLQRSGSAVLVPFRSIFCTSFRLAADNSSPCHHR